jgi:hypothetical protein
LVLLLGTAAVVLLPYATVTLRHRPALVVQAVGILVVVLSMLALGAWRHGRWNPRSDESRVPLAGLGIWTAAALAGGVSGLLHGNNAALVVGQLLSLGLLPLGALAGAAVSGTGVWRWFRWGLVGATTAAVLVHLVFWVWSLARGAVFGRLQFHNGVSPAGVSLLALLAALSLAVGGERRQRIVGACCAGAISMLIFASAVRSLWLVSVLAVVVFLVVAAYRGGAARLLLGAAAGVLGCIAVVCGLVAVWLSPARLNLVPDGGIGPAPRIATPSLAVVPAPAEQGGFAFAWEPSTPHSVVLAKVGVGEGGIYRLRAWLRGSGEGVARVALHCKAPWAGYCGSGFVSSMPTGAWRLGQSVFLLPAGSTICQLCLEIDEGATGTWLARPVSLERLGDASFVPLLALQLHAIWERTAVVLADFLAGAGIQDASIAGRLAESAAVVKAVREGGVMEKVFGHGLGATYHYTSSTRDAEDRWQTLEFSNYIHNFYLFLVFKLGVLGAAAMVGALALWIGWTARNASLLVPGPEGIFLAAAALAWVAYTLWSVACPEILDFRVAPLWGLLLVASADACTDGTAKSSERRAG